MVELRNGRLASASSDKTVRIWDAATGECARTMEEHTDAVIDLALPYNGLLASGSYDGAVCMWDVEKGVCVRTL